MCCERHLPALVAVPVWEAGGVDSSGSEMFTEASGPLCLSSLCRDAPSPSLGWGRSNCLYPLLVPTEGVAVRSFVSSPGQLWSPRVDGQLCRWLVVWCSVFSWCRPELVPGPSQHAPGLVYNGISHLCIASRILSFISRSPVIPNTK